MSKLVEEIQKGYQRGWSFTPLEGKRPYLDAWQQQQRPSLDQCIEWANAGNVGLRTGQVSGVAVIDIDHCEGETPTAFRDQFPRTWTTWTGGGGFHLYYRATFPVKNVVGKNKPGVINPATGELCKVDVRGDGGQVVFVGSVHPYTGKEYHWMFGTRPDQVAISEFPYHLLIEKPGLPSTPKPEPKPRPQVDTSRIPAYARAALEREVDAVAQAQEGGRNDRLNVAAYNLGQLVGAGVLGEGHVQEELLIAANTCGLDDSEALRTIASGMTAGKAQPRRNLPDQQQRPAARPASVEPVGVDAF